MFDGNSLRCYTDETLDNTSPQWTSENIGSENNPLLIVIYCSWPKAPSYGIIFVKQKRANFSDLLTCHFVIGITCHFMIGLVIENFFGKMQ